MKWSLLWRNAELRQLFFSWIGITLLAATYGFYLQKPAGFLVLASSALLCLLTLFFTRKRYRALADLSQLLDRILHGEDALNIEDHEEGELSLLRSELSKMTLRLRDQADSLKQDKILLGESIADISHQLRTPLTSLQLICSFLHQDDLTEERHLQLLREASALLKRMDWLISALLKFSRLDIGVAVFQEKPVSAIELLNSAAKPLAIQMELRDQNLQISGDKGASFRGDFAWSLEAIGNILKNCMEHTPNGGNITAACLHNPLYAEIKICDNGSGIDPVDLPYIFQRFYKGKNAGENSIGIGLALARAIINRQNGTIKAENQLSGGCCFIIRFYQRIV